MASCFGFLQLLFCGGARPHRRSRKGSADSSDPHKQVKIRVGFEGKDTLFSTDNLNVKTTFGQFAVLLDNASNQLVPLHSNGSTLEPLTAGRRYVVVLNTHGSSAHKWEGLRKSGELSKKHSGSKKHSKHGSDKKKRTKSSKVKYDSMNADGSDCEVKEPLIQPEPPSTNFSTISFGVSMDSMMSHQREVYAY